MEVPVTALGLSTIPFIRFEDDESWVHTTRYGWNPGGELYPVVGAAVWDTVAPPHPYLPADDAHLVYTLGSGTVPTITPADDEVWKQADDVNRFLVVPYLPADDVYGIQPLGVVTIPYVDQNDQEVFKSIYPGGV